MCVVGCELCELICKNFLLFGCLSFRLRSDSSFDGHCSNSHLPFAVYAKLLERAVVSEKQLFAGARHGEDIRI